MELLQKLTLYDLFGYTFPGVIALLLFYGDVSYLAEELTLGGLVLLAVLGYVAGVMITELAECLECLVKKILGESKIKAYWEKLCGDYGITDVKVNDALLQAKLIENAQNDSAGVVARKYRTYMYSEIQTDSQYSRLHNYASAELLYKNMAVTAVLAIGAGVVQQNTAEIIIGVVSAVLFVRRRICFAERSRGYTLCWFVQKYSR